jgi:type 1 glutamine amidotransferase
MKALIFYGGWNGHTPKESAEIIAGELGKNGVEVTMTDKLDILADEKTLAEMSLIVPVWTMGSLSNEQSKGLLTAVKNGVGLGGFHGGAGDAFRGNIDYEWMVGGIFVGHPHVGKYTVNVLKSDFGITECLGRSFEYESEQYYMLVDPANNVLAETVYSHAGDEIRMPVVWTKKWGKGKVFYSALGHKAEEFVKYPAVLEMTVKGLLWAAR